MAQEKSEGVDRRPLRAALQGSAEAEHIIQAWLRQGQAQEARDAQATAERERQQQASEEQEESEAAGQ